MTWVKICGITNLEDALTAVEAGADALGFVFHRQSPRYVSPDVVKEIVARLPPAPDKVGVFVGDSPAETAEKKRIVHQAGLTAIQVHSFSPSSSLRTLNDLSSVATKLFVVWPAPRVFHGRFGGLSWGSDVQDKVSAIFLDSGTPKKPGGTGKTFDWAKAAPVLSAINGNLKFVIAGGLTPDNVGEAIRTLKPFGVDVSSGVEARPGKKDPDKVRAFIEAVRRAEKNS
ncbi:MAG: phosphoribosylanthranilate isomerase [Terriglobales bacterium]